MPKSFYHIHNVVLTWKKSFQNIGFDEYLLLSHFFEPLQFEKMGPMFVTFAFLNLKSQYFLKHSHFFMKIIIKFEYPKLIIHNWSHANAFASGENGTTIFQAVSELYWLLECK